MQHDLNRKRQNTDDEHRHKLIKIFTTLQPYIDLEMDTPQGPKDVELNDLKELPIDQLTDVMETIVADLQDKLDTAPE